MVFQSPSAEKVGLFADVARPDNIGQYIANLAIEEVHTWGV